MKRILALGLCVMLAIALVGCNGASTDGLQISDFDVYENGKVAVNHKAFKGNSLPFTDDSEGRALETSRGVKIGSTARDVAEAYDGIATSRLTQSDTQNITFSEFLQNREKYDNGNATESYRDYAVWYIICDVDGKIMNLADFENMVKEKGFTVENFDYEETPVNLYGIEIWIKNDEVANVYVNNVDLKERSTKE